MSFVRVFKLKKTLVKTETVLYVWEQLGPIVEGSVGKMARYGLRDFIETPILHS